MDILITKATPELLFQFLEAVSSLHSSTLHQIRSCLKAPNLGIVYSARAISQYYGFVECENEEYRLTTLGTRLLSYTDVARVDFLVNCVKLQEKEPFLFLKKELQKNQILRTERMGELLQIKFRPKEKWSREESKRIGDIYAQWLEKLRQARINKDSVEYIGGKVKTFEVLVIPEMGVLLDRRLYDFLVENFHTPHNLLDKPYELLKKVEECKDANAKGEAFEDFVGNCFLRFGFSPRIHDGVREKNANLTYQRKGGGDIGLFCHFPTPTSNKTHQGYAIACEAKAGQFPIGSKAVGQVRNLSQKIKEFFPDYLVHTIVVSRSKDGYDSSGREQAPPEVVHINHRVLLGLLEKQKNRLEKGLPLITPVQFMTVLRWFIGEQELEPSISEFLEKTEAM